MRGRKQKARSKREMIEERSELGLVCRPMRRPVEPEGEKHDIGCGQQRCFRKIGAGEEAHDESEFEHRRDPSQNMGRGETRRRDEGRRCVDVHQLEAHRHNKERGKDQASYEDRRPRPYCPVRFRRHVPLLLICESRSSAGSQVEPPLDGRDRLLSNMRRTGPARIDTPSCIFLLGERIKDRIARRSPVLEAVLNGAHRSYVHLAPRSHPSTGRIGASLVTPLMIDRMAAVGKSGRWTSVCNQPLADGWPVEGLGGFANAPYTRNGGSTS